jgi:hypothetical protein
MEVDKASVRTQGDFILKGHDGDVGYNNCDGRKVDGWCCARLVIWPVHI